jgi:murein L,D-transpeptidase YcbB/YkuD
MRICLALRGSPARAAQILLCLVAIYAAGVSAPVVAAPEAVTISELVAQLPDGDAVVRDFYRLRGYQSAWHPTDIGILQASLARAAADGLNPDDYTPVIQGSPEIRDVNLTRAAVNYLRDMRQGREALRLIDSDVALPQASFDAAKALNDALNANALASLLADSAPESPDYIHLRDALKLYRGIDNRGGWPNLVLPVQDPAGLTDRQARSLRDRLAYEEPVLADASAPDLISALQRFQGRHGLAPSAHIDGATIAELNVTAAYRVKQLAANMERLRWLPRRLEPDHILVNVPDAHLSLVLGGKEVLASRVVVGKPATPTPILRAEGAGLTVNPPWNIPESIARNEILPKLKADRSYLKKQDMVLLNGPPGDPYGLSVTWRKIPKGTFPYLIQQHPGGGNPLGTVKLELPNKFDVYLHDTPAKKYFSQVNRDISHGCVRVERILPLASYALSKTPDDMAVIVDAISRGETKYFPLKRQLPVYFLYQTAFVDAAGTLQLRPDIYGRDQRMIAMQDAKASSIDAFRMACATASARRG